MPQWLYLQDMYPLILTDVNNIAKSAKFLSKSDVFDDTKKLSDILRINLSPRYKGLRCFMHETDYEHHNEYFLSEVRGVSFDIGSSGFSLYISFKKKGRFANDNTCYELEKGKISRGNLERLLGMELRKVNEDSWLKEPKIELFPEKIRDEQDACGYDMLLIQDGKTFLKANSS